MRGKMAEYVCTQSRSVRPRPAFDKQSCVKLPLPVFRAVRMGGFRTGETHSGLHLTGCLL
jgi:hypothetical protein